MQEYGVWFDLVDSNTIVFFFFVFIYSFFYFFVLKKFQNTALG